MGTRHLTCVYVNGEYKVAQYGQWDGYPEGAGVNILEFLLKMDRPAFEERLSHLSFISKEYISRLWVEAGAVPGSETVSIEIYDHFTRLHPELSRDTGSDVLDIIASSMGDLLLDNDLNFAANSLSCEWAYVVDLDSGTFEVYEGFNKRGLDEKERFSFLSRLADRDYYPVKHVVTFYLEDLPDKETFLKTVQLATNDGGEGDQ